MISIRAMPGSTKQSVCSVQPTVFHTYTHRSTSFHYAGSTVGNLVSLLEDFTLKRYRTHITRQWHIFAKFNAERTSHIICPISFQIHPMIIIYKENQRTTLLHIVHQRLLLHICQVFLQFIAQRRKHHQYVNFLQ